QVVNTARVSMLLYDESDMEEDFGHEEEEESSEEEMSDEGDNAFEAALIYDVEASPHEFLKEDVKMAAKKHPELERQLCIPSVQIEPPASGNEGMCSVVLTINVSNLPEMLRHLWELGNAMTVSVIVDNIHKAEYRTHERRPMTLSRLNSDKPSRFPVGECLCNVVKPMITNEYWLPENASPSETGSFFAKAYEKMMERMNTLTDIAWSAGINYTPVDCSLPSVVESSASISTRNSVS
ncbi:hypothetical protein PMAYCL1PPCAC_24391, partial [Pristionchus mayeri]